MKNVLLTEKNKKKYYIYNLHTLNSQKEDINFNLSV